MYTSCHQLQQLTNVLIHKKSLWFKALSTHQSLPVALQLQMGPVFFFLQAYLFALVNLYLSFHLCHTLLTDLLQTKTAHCPVWVPKYDIRHRRSCKPYKPQALQPSLDPIVPCNPHDPTALYYTITKAHPKCINRHFSQELRNAILHNRFKPLKTQSVCRVIWLHDQLCYP